MLTKLASKAKSSIKSATRADEVASTPLTQQAVGMTALGLGASYASGTMADESSSRATPVPSLSNPLSDLGEAAETQMRDFALGQAGVETPGTGASSPTFMAAAAAGVGTGAYQYFGKNTAGAAFRKQFGGKSWFKPQSGGKLFGSQTLARGAKAGGNVFQRAMKGAGAVAMGTFVAAGAASIIDRSTERLSKKVLQTGTPGTRLSNNNVLKGNQATSSRGRPTTSSVSRYAGNQQNMMDGSTVLALHKTGGRGAVLGG